MKTGHVRGLSIVLLPQKKSVLKPVNPFQPKSNKPLKAAAIIGTAVVSLVFFIIGMVSGYAVYQIAIFTALVAVASWIFLSAFLNRRR